LDVWISKSPQTTTPTQYAASPLVKAPLSQSKPHTPQRTPENQKNISSSLLVPHPQSIPPTLQSTTPLKLGTSTVSSSVSPTQGLPARTKGFDDGIRYARLDLETLVEDTFEQAMNRGRIKDLPVVLVVTSYGWPPRFPLDWINRQPWPAFVSTKVPGKGVHSEPWGNIGQEDATYFHFITKFWDDLPERMVFLHGHNKAWHQEGYLMEYLLRNACFNETEYMSVNAFPAIRSPKGSGKAANEWAIIKKYWEPLGQGRLGPFPAKGLREKCCAQFMVHRDRIKRHPKEFYAMQRDQMTDPKKSYKREMKKMGVHVGFDLVLFYESVWHVMWGENPWIKDDKYGFCVDMDIERERPTPKNKDRSRCMKNVIHCPQALCQESPTCRVAVEEAKTARGKG